MTYAGKRGLALVGNPGAGKSTILNGIAGSPAFKSGISVGTGLTKHLARYDTGAIVLYDTPGLSDIEKVKEAGMELDTLLSEDVDMGIVFVVTLESGRARPVDASTIDAVLSAIQEVDVTNRFGVIINQLSKKVYDILENDVESAAKVRNSLTGRFSTSHWHYVRKDGELEEVDDGQLMNKDLALFLTGIPMTKPHNAEVKRIDTDTLEEKKREHEARMAEVQGQHRAQMEEMMKQIESEKAEAAERMAAVEKQYDDMQREYEEMEKRHESAEKMRERMEERVQEMQDRVEEVQEEHRDALIRADTLEMKYAEAQRQHKEAEGAADVLGKILNVGIGVLPSLLLGLVKK